MITPPQLFYLYALVYLVVPTNVDCDDYYCQQCDYDCTIDEDGICITDNYLSCIACDYYWSDSRICNKMNCNSIICTKCDFTGNYCIGCNSDYYDFSVNGGCYLNPTMTGIVTTFSIILFIVLIWLCCCCCRCCCCYHQCCLQRYRQKKILEMARAMYMQNINNPNLSIDQRDECSICLEDNCEVISRCGHPFHAPCLYIWLTNKNSCPNCNLKLINIVKIISCLECRTQTKQYNILQFNRESIYKIQHEICDNCQFRPIDSQQELAQNKFHNSVPQS